MTDYSSISQKIVLITGATSGFGRGTATTLAQHGASLVLAARSVDELESVRRECSANGGTAIVVPTDVSDRAAMDQLATRALEHFGRIDVWINNAGVAAIGQFDEVPIEDHEQIIQTDLLGTIYGSYHAMRHFRQRGSGTLINIASVIGKIPAPYYASYAAAKFGVVGLSDALRLELKQDNLDEIHVCTVMPMAHDTGFFENAGNYTGHESAPIPPTHDPQVTIDKLVELTVHPEDEVITGAQGKLFNIFHKLMPGTIETVMAINTEKSQFENAKPGPVTSGSIHRPK